MRRLIKPILAVMALALAYLAMLPATWLDALLQRATQGTLAMTGTRGTMWRGEGSLQAILPSGQAVTLAPAAWRIALGELPTLRLHLTMKSLQTDQPILDVSLAPRETRIHEAKLDMPAAVLGVLSPTLRAAALSGQLALQVTDLRLDAARSTGKARAVWLMAASDLSRVRPLGSYQVDLDGQGSGMDIHLTTLGGVLNLTGAGHWQPGQAPDFKITAVPSEAKRQEMAPLLRMLGRETSPGSYLITIDPNVRAVSG